MDIFAAYGQLLAELLLVLPCQVSYMYLSFYASRNDPLTFTFVCLSVCLSVCVCVKVPP